MYIDYTHNHNYIYNCNYNESNVKVPATGGVCVEVLCDNMYTASRWFFALQCIGLYGSVLRASVRCCFDLPFLHGAGTTLFDERFIRNSAAKNHRLILEMFRRKLNTNL